MRTRKETTQFIKQQFKSPDCQAVPNKHLRNRDPQDGKKAPWHYGVCELRLLLDFIYEGEPSLDDRLESKYLLGGYDGV